MNIGQRLERLLPRSAWMQLLAFRFRLFDPYKVASWSQAGEDMILRHVFETQPRGFYVDVGAHHPLRYSNTFHFYRLGWRGINIDATPGSMDLFKVMRPRDINVEAAVGDTKRRLTFYQFNDPAVSTFDPALAKKRDGNIWKLIAQRELETQSLAQILATHLPANQAIDFLSIDVEGMDEQVLRSNDWQRYRPRVVVIECLEQDAAQVMGSAPAAFLQARGYALLAKTAHTAFFITDHV